MNKQLFVLAQIDGEYIPTLMEDTLENYYNLIDCRCIDIVSVKIGLHRFAIVCDDEFLLKDDIGLPRAFYKDGSDKMCPYLFGNFVIAKEGEDGELDSIDENDVEYIKRHLVEFYDANHRTIFKCLKVSF